MPARADDVKDAIALFDKGQKLLDAGQLDAACEAFAASVKLDPQLGAKLNLANCRERQGRLVEAAQLYEDALAEAARTNKKNRETFARQHLDAVRPRIAKLTIRVTEPRAPGIVVRAIRVTGTIDL